MLNHFRTLLLNLDYSGNEEEHIPSKFIPIVLPKKLGNIHAALFPEASSRFHRTILAHNYLNIIDASGFSDEVKAYDPRISYDLTNSDFFKVNIVSNPKVSNLQFPIMIFGQLTHSLDRDYFHDVFLVRQKADTLNISVYSRNKSKYLLGVSEYNLEDDALIPLSFASGSSNLCFVGTTGLRFNIGGSAVSFQETSNKTWEFSAEAPIEVNMLDIYNQLVALVPFKTLKSFKVDLAEYEYIWDNQKNLLYKLSAFLLAYVKVLDSLCLT